jgi:hypothetical protein
MSRFRWESDLYDPVAGYVRRRGYRQQGAEVPFFDYRIDLYAYSRCDMLSVAIELKLTNWKRAVHQALIYQLAADITFVALPRYNVGDNAIAACSAYGIGVIAVGITGRCEQVLKPKPSDDVKDWYREQLVALVEG